MVNCRSPKSIVAVLVLLISVVFVSGDPECQELPVIDNGELLTSENPPFKVNDTVGYQCNEDFRTDETSPKVTCVLKDNFAHWTKGTCKPIVVSCHDPGYIENSSRIGGMFTFPHNITYVCHRGFRMNGHATKYCSKTGQWQPPSMPYCEAILCPALSHPPHGEVLQSHRTLDSVAAYKCDRYHKLVGEKERKCQDDGTWSGSNPICEKITCAAPGKFPNGRIIGKNDTVYNANDILIFQCIDGSHHISSKCLDSGDWSVRLPNCPGTTVSELTTVTTVPTDFPEDGNIKNEVKCDHPGTIKNGNGTYMGLYINSTVTYICDEGYYLRGKSTLICLENGKWDLDKLPICDLNAKVGSVNYGIESTVGRNGLGKMNENGVKPLSSGAIIGIIFGVILLVCIVVGGYLWYRYRMKSIRGYGEKSKALTADAADIEEIAGLEKEKKHIPVTVL